jgi:hypothetical protein
LIYFGKQKDHIKILETQSQRMKDVPLGESWIVHIFIA